MKFIGNLELYDCEICHKILPVQNGKQGVCKECKCSVMESNKKTHKKRK